MRRHQYSLSDFLAQMAQLQGLGPLRRRMGMIPGMRELTQQVGMTEADVATQWVRMRAVYRSMSRAERSDPDLLNASRRQRIARGAGVAVGEVTQFIKQFQLSREMADAIGRPGARPMGKIGLILGLVTSDRSRRDPSWVHPWIPVPSRDWALWFVLGIVTLIFVALACATG